MKEIRVTAHGADILPIDALIEFQGNLKTITRANLDKLKRSILKHGFTAPIFVWKGVDNHILDGHQRLKALVEMRQEGYNIPLLPVVYIDADSEVHAKEKLLYITSQYGEFSTDGFTAFAEGLDFDFSDIRLADGEFTFQVDETEETAGDDETPELQDEVVSELGEIYELGPHRLMCGDSTDREQVLRLMGSEKADMVFTDPPYGVDYDGINNDDRDGLEALLSKVFANYSEFSKSGAAAYVFHSDKCADIFHAVFRSYFHFSSMVIWAKNSLTLSRTDYQSQHEPCLYGWIKGGPHTFHGNRKETSIWKFDKERVVGHTTPKPVALIEKAIKNSSKGGDIICDFFGGSGSTMIACGKLDREARIIELDPKYCDVIRRRWTKWAKENGHAVGSGGLEDEEV